MNNIHCIFRFCGCWCSIAWWQRKVYGMIIEKMQKNNKQTLDERISNLRKKVMQNAITINFNQKRTFLLNAPTVFPANIKFWPLKFAIAHNAKEALTRVQEAKRRYLDSYNRMETDDRRFYFRPCLFFLIFSIHLLHYSFFFICKQIITTIKLWKNTMLLTTKSYTL